MSIPQKVIDKLMSKVKVGNADECWITDYVDYRFSCKGKFYNINTVFYFSVFNEMPVNRVTKTCKNSKCCNPNHLIKEGNLFNYTKSLLDNPDNFDSVFSEYTGDYCKVWKGSKVNGYGCFYYKNTQYFLHRIVLELDGVDLTSKVARHKCHNRSCCNLEHLESGSHHDNIMDTVLAGRGNAKLTIEQALVVIELLKTNIKADEIASKLNIDAHLVYKICYGQSWSHLSNMPKGSKRSDWRKDKPKQLSLFD